MVALFRKQIADGGPITLTDERITRYFMTIPEAAQLVIQAGAMASGGEVFVLDMGESVRIMKANEEFLPWPQYQALLAQLQQARETHNVPQMRHLIGQLVPGYQPETDIVDWVTLAQN